MLPSELREVKVGWDFVRCGSVSLLRPFLMHLDTSLCAYTWGYSFGACAPDQCIFVYGCCDMDVHVSVYVIHPPCWCLVRSCPFKNTYCILLLSANESHMRGLWKPEPGVGLYQPRHLGALKYKLWTWVWPFPDTVVKRHLHVLIEMQTVRIALELAIDFTWASSPHYSLSPEHADGFGGDRGDIRQGPGV